MFASQNGHKEVVEILLSAGADVHLLENVCDIYYCDCFVFLYFVGWLCTDNSPDFYFLVLFS